MNEKNNQKQDTEWISLASVAACIAVVFLHTNGCFWQFQKARYWVTANIIECIFIFAVPCFFMISGATLIDYRERYSLQTYIKKRTIKTVIPFLAWSLIGIPFNIIAGYIQTSDVNLKFIWNGVVDTSIVSIYWFFPALFGVYLSIPIFAATRKESRKEIFSYAAVTCYILGGVLPLLGKTVLPGYNWSLNINAASGYLMYVMVGYLIRYYEIPKNNRLIIYAFSLAGLLLHIFGTYILSYRAGELVTTYKGNANAPCIMYSVGIMVWMRYGGNSLLKSKIIRNIVHKIKPYTFSIYLLQYFIYTSLIRIFDINTTSLVYRLGAPFIIIPIAIGIAWIIKKIPIMKMILP